MFMMVKIEVRMRKPKSDAVFATNISQQTKLPFKIGSKLRAKYEQCRHFFYILNLFVEK